MLCSRSLVSGGETGSDCTGFRRKECIRSSLLLSLSCLVPGLVCVFVWISYARCACDDGVYPLCCVWIPASNQVRKLVSIQFDSPFRSIVSYSLKPFAAEAPCLLVQKEGRRIIGAEGE